MWQEKDHALYKQFMFKDFTEAFKFMEAVAVEAEAQQHHPRWQNEYNKVDIWLSTHETGRLITDKDRLLAKTIDQVFKAIQSTNIVDKGTTNITEIKLYADGGSRGNPGPSASGYVLLDMSDKVLVEKGIYLGITTNNQAEYKALQFALEEAKRLGVEKVSVYMDSLLVINQVLGKFKVKHHDLLPIYSNVKQLAAKFQEISFTHVPRALNKLADAMVNKALDEELGIIS